MKCQVNKMVFAAIMAGGTGTRMGAEIPKQYLPLCGIPVLMRTVEKFINSPTVKKTVVLCPAEWVEETRRMAKEYLPGSEGKLAVTAGGSSRNATLEKSVAFVQREFGAADTDVLITHDGVRPFLTEHMIAENAAVAAKFGACNTVIPATDTLVISRDGRFVTETPDRSLYYHSQTPQSFVIGQAKACLDALTGAQREKLTDACMLFTLNGRAVATVEGDPKNIKLTRPSDMRIGELFLNDK